MDSFKIKQDNVLILGAGNGGLALAALLKIQGCKIGIWSASGHRKKLSEIEKLDAEIKVTGTLTKTASIDKIFNNLSDAVHYADIIYNCLPIFAHDQLLLDLHDLVISPKIIVNLSGCFSSISYLSKEKNPVNNNIKLFDTSTFPYACRYEDRNIVNILGIKSCLPIAPLYKADIEYLYDIPKKARPTEFKILDNSIKLSLSGTNATFHPCTVLFNAARIDNSDCNFYFYKEGISKNTSKLHESVELERISLGKIMNFDLEYCVEDDNLFYGTEFKDLYDFCVNSKVHNQEYLTPKNLNHRYIYEDVKYGLIPLYFLGKKYGIHLKNIESVIQIFSTICSENFFDTGRTLKTLTKEQINAL